MCASSGGEALEAPAWIKPKRPPTITLGVYAFLADWQVRVLKGSAFPAMNANSSSQRLLATGELQLLGM